MMMIIYDGTAGRLSVFAKNQTDMIVLCVVWDLSCEVGVFQNLVAEVDRTRAFTIIQRTDDR